MGQINIAVFNGRRKAKNDLDDPLPPGYLYRAGSSLRYDLKGGLEEKKYFKVFNILNHSAPPFRG